jgi:hypothetical protein
MLCLVPSLIDLANGLIKNLIVILKKNIQKNLFLLQQITILLVFIRKN